MCAVLRRTRRNVHTSEHFEIALRRGAADGVPLWMAVPKRLLQRAIDRNTLRRIIREAWRAAHGDIDAGEPVLLRLVRRPHGFGELAQRERKRRWRGELDALIALAQRGMVGAPVDGADRGGNGR